MMLALIPELINFTREKGESERFSGATAAGHTALRTFPDRPNTVLKPSGRRLLDRLHGI
ncbi:MAG: hypothetical protein U5K76_05360 [Woeseiaceae bacterium]|nr:hypothetical protein [Woeseiaceae bacterium]